MKPSLIATDSAGNRYKVHPENPIAVKRYGYLAFCLLPIDAYGNLLPADGSHAGYPVVTVPQGGDPVRCSCGASPCPHIRMLGRLGLLSRPARPAPYAVGARRW